MKRSGIKRGDLARALAERIRLTGGQLREGQAQDELDRIVHGIVTGLRQGRPVEMPGVGMIIAQIPVDVRLPAKRVPASKPAAKKKVGAPAGKPKS